MQNANNYAINAGTVTGTSLLPSSALPASQWVAVSMQASFSSGTSAGTVKIQCSNDVSGGKPNFVPTNWSDVPGSTATATVVAGATVLVYVPVNFVAKYYRSAFTPSAGSGTYTITFDALYP